MKCPKILGNKISVPKFLAESCLPSEFFASRKRQLTFLNVKIVKTTLSENARDHFSPVTNLLGDGAIWHCLQLDYGIQEPRSKVGEYFTQGRSRFAEGSCTEEDACKLTLVRISPGMWMGTIN